MNNKALISDDATVGLTWVNPLLNIYNIYTKQYAVINSPSMANVARWFKKDDNAVPSTYILQPISSQLPDVLSTEEAPRTKAENQWLEESEAMHVSIGEAAVTCLSKERAHTIMQSGK